MWRTHLLPALADNSVPLDSAVQVARTVAAADPRWCLRLARFITNPGAGEEKLDDSTLARMLDVLESLGDVPAMQLAIRSMLIHPSPKIRAKISRLVAEGAAQPAALRTLLKDDDARVRANAVEALWSRHDREALELLRESLQDSNNRVLGNAILGLHAAGDPASIPAAISLSTHESALFRSTAAWVMGKTGDPRFTPYVARLLAESQGQLRKTAFRALESLKRTALDRAKKKPLRVIILESLAKQNTRLQIRFAAAASFPDPLTLLRGTDVIVSCNGEAIQRFQFEQAPSEGSAVAVLLPSAEQCAPPLAQFREALLKGLEMKRSKQYWGVFNYREAGAAPIAAVQPESPNSRWTSSNLQALRIALQARTPAASTGLDAAALAILKGQWPVQSNHHLIVGITDPNSLSSERRQELERLAIEKRVHVHLFYLGGVPAAVSSIESALNSTSVFPHSSKPGEISDDVALVCSSTVRQYTVEFDCPDGAATNPPSVPISLKISSAAGSGEARYGSVGSSLLEAA